MSQTFKKIHRLPNIQKESEGKEVDKTGVEDKDMGELVMSQANVLREKVV